MLPSGPGYNDDIVSFDKYGFTLGADTYYLQSTKRVKTMLGGLEGGGNKNTFNVDDVGCKSLLSSRIRWWNSYS